MNYISNQLVVWKGIFCVFGPISPYKRTDTVSWLPTANTHLNLGISSTTSTIFYSPKNLSHYKNNQATSKAGTLFKPSFESFLI